MSILVFDSNVLTCVFTQLINVAYIEKGCEYAYSNILTCYNVCPKWGNVISKQLMRHITLPKKIKEINAIKTKVHHGDYKLTDIWPGYKKVEISLEFNIRFDFTITAGHQQVSPKFKFAIEPKCYHFLTGQKFCEWCCILHFDRTKKHHGKRCILKRK